MGEIKAMTKEEILIIHSGGQVYNDGLIYDGSTDEIYDAMDAYAKQQSISFTEWAATNKWYFNKIQRWSNRGDTSDNLIGTLSSMKTTTELYQLYKKSNP